MADDLLLNAGSGGKTLRSLQDAGTIDYPVGVTAFATTIGTPDVVQIVTSTTGLPVRLSDGSGYITTLAVSLASVPSHAVTNAGTFAVQVDGAALTALQLLDNLVLAEDAAHGSGDPGVQILAVRRDSAASSSATDGDYVTLNTDSTGRLWCNVSNTLTVGSHDVTNAGTFAVQAAQSGTWTVGISAAQTLATVTTVGTVTTITNVVHVDDNGSTLSVDDGGGSLTVDGSVSVSGLVPGVSATSLGKAEDAVAADGDTGVMTLAVRKDTAATTVGADGDYHPLEVDGNGRLWVNGSSVTQPVSLASVPSHAVTNAGTFAVQVDGAALTALQLIDDAVSGAGFNISQLNGVAVTMGNGASGTGVQRVTLANDSTGVLATVSTVTTVSTLTGGGVAHDAADSGNPHKIGAKATTSLAGLTLVANADRTDLFSGIDGALIVREHCNLEDIVTGLAAITDGSSTSVIAAQGAGIKTYITSVIIANSSASNVTVDLRDGAAGNVKATFPAPTGGGVVHALPVPLAFSANTAVAADPSAAASTVTVTLIGFKSKV